jgi:hypothetical protein
MEEEGEDTDKHGERSNISQQSESGPRHAPLPASLSLITDVSSVPVRTRPLITDALRQRHLGAAAEGIVQRSAVVRHAAHVARLHALAATDAALAPLFRGDERRARELSTRRQRKQEKKKKKKRRREWSAENCRSAVNMRCIPSAVACCCTDLVAVGDGRGLCVGTLGCIERGRERRVASDADALDRPRLGAAGQTATGRTLRPVRRPPHRAALKRWDKTRIQHIAK